VVTENYEPIAWAEELIEPAHAVDHPRLAALYMMASHCYLAGRIEDGVRYSDAAQTVLGSDWDELPFGVEGVLGSAYLAIGQPERWLEWCQTQLERGRDTHAVTRACLVIALMQAGFADEAMATAKGLIEAAEATHNPWALSLALFLYGLALRDADPDRALEALRRGMVIAQDSGNRANETHLVAGLSRFEAKDGDPTAALEHVTVALHNYHDSGNTIMMCTPLLVLATLFDRLERYAPAATIAGFAFNPLAAAGVPEIAATIAHLRDVIGGQTYESLARQGETMTAAAMVTYAYDQIDQARTELEHPS
jgi:tetratricopeptide (TPR) repeat protein